MLGARFPLVVGGFDYRSGTESPAQWKSESRGGSVPEYWQAHAVRSNEMNEKFSWDSKSGQVRITIGKSYDSAAWRQTLSLDPGRHCLRGEVLASEHLPDFDVAMFGIESGKESHSFGWMPEHPNGWSRGTLYFKVGIKEVDVVCRLTGSDGSVSREDLSLTQLDAALRPASSPSTFSRKPRQCRQPYSFQIRRPRTAMTTGPRPCSWA
jgi:hypothetical protein